MSGISDSDIDESEIYLLTGWVSGYRKPTVK